MAEDVACEPNHDEGAHWTVETLRVYNQALRRADERFESERDRRYSSEDTLRERALAIKERADERALGLAREIQAYKDEKANELRSQIESERGRYLTVDAFEERHKGLEKDIQTLRETVVTFVSAAEASGRRGQQFSNAVIAWAGVALLSLSVVVGLLIKFA